MTQPIIVTSVEQLESIVTKAVTKVLPKQSDIPKKRLLSAKEVEKEYGWSERTLERWRAEGVGPSYTITGRRIYYERNVLDQFIEAGRIKTGF